MVKCSVLGCTSDSDKEQKHPDLSFHSFPENDYLRQKWIEATGRTNWTACKYSKICSKHFEQNLLVKKTKRSNLLPHAVPSQTLFLPECGEDQKKGHVFYCLRCGAQLFIFPKDPNLKQKWIDVTRRKNWFPSNGSVVCSRHFTEDCFHVTKARRRLFDTAIPTQHLPLLINMTNTQVPEQQFPKPSSSIHQSISTTSTKKGESTDIETPSQFDSPIETRISKRRILELSGKVSQKNKKLKKLQDKVRYFKNRVASLKKKTTLTFCPNCNTELKLEYMEEPMVNTRAVIAKVYHYLEFEYLALKRKFGDLNLSTLINIHARTADATGVSQSMVCEALKEEKYLNEVNLQVKLADKRKTDQDVPVRGERLQDSSEEDTSSEESDDNDSNDDDVHTENQSQEQAKPEIETVEIKVEPIDEETCTEQAEPKTETVEIKVEPIDEETHNTNNQSKTSTHRVREFRERRKRRADDSITATQQREQAEPASATLAVHTTPPDDRTHNSKQNFLLIDAGKIIMRGDVKEEKEEYTFHESDMAEVTKKEDPDIKMEEIEFTEEGFT